MVFPDLSISNGRLKSAAPESGRNRLDRHCRNVYKRRAKKKGTPLRSFVAKSLILVGRRTAAGG
jgi:hypothetical protein